MLLTEKSFYTIIFCFLFFLLAYNSSTVFYVHVSVPLATTTSPDLFSISTENAAGKSRKLVSLIKQETQKTQFIISRKNQNFISFTYKNPNFMGFLKKRKKKRDHFVKFKTSAAKMNNFSSRIKEFFNAYSCKFKFFMTWISSIESFSEREIFVIESLFKSHPKGCLVIMSNSLDSQKGMQIIMPFLKNNLRVIALSPDFNYLFKNSVAEFWINSLMNGNVKPGEVSLGQNLSNLLRLGVLYKFGGIYLDTDVIVLKSFGKLRNVIGAQTIDVETKNWSRLNNAVMIFDKGHPLLYKFIEEFALTFDGNKWGHNGPYLVSRVVSRVSGRDGYNFTVLNPMAFYPVDWSRIGSLFVGPRNEAHSKWLMSKLKQIRGESYAVHLWNKQSRRLKVEDGSIVQHIMSDCCVFCNSYSSKL